MGEESQTRVETELEVKAYIQDLKYAINNGAQIQFQAKRRVDEDRVELLGQYGKTTTFVMSFHFAEKAFTPEMFPYRKN